MSQTTIYTLNQQREVEGHTYVAFNARSTVKTPVLAQNRHRGCYIPNELLEVSDNAAIQWACEEQLIAHIRSWLAANLTATNYQLPSCADELLAAAHQAAFAKGDSITAEMVEAWFNTSATRTEAGQNAAKLGTILRKLAAKNYYGACNPATAERALSMIADDDLVEAAAITTMLVTRLQTLADSASQL